MVEQALAVSRTRLWIEFAVLYIGAPLLIALFMPGDLLFPALAVFMVGGIALLWLTGGFDLRDLLRGWGRVPLAKVVLFGLITAAIAWWIMQTTRPDYMRPLTLERLRFLVMVWTLYPLLSALPQELIFRPLFFHRYGALFPDQRVGLLVNAAVFSFAHLMYWSWIVAILTFAGGLVFALAYVRRGFPSAWLFHGIAGNVLFTMGMGAYFYTGNVVRPF
ncbi:CPBP family intramembrane glutamic endopeptidase [Paracoccus sulfuroxidans]|uniref:CAAX prenyl protease-like protein n=1 Tax=Paracoccus sulfuroxidans TaxID=384678 RepID=A0A562NSB4_9RHOB|nr:CPBP family intramembrane glutamic endopeptidase [Paracoccus sulfuroxidans]TWI35097.1 CAAX prenyl protease-like protein [Paracoccus sulfuroxidans]